MQGKKTLRHLALLLIAIAALLGVVQIALRQISTELLHRILERDLAQALGREVKLDGLTVALLPTPRLQATGFRVSARPESVAPSPVSIARLDLFIGLWPLFERKLVIDSLEVEGVDLHLETDEAGRVFGGFRIDELVDGNDSDLLELEVRQLYVENLLVFYRDGRGGTSHSLRFSRVSAASRQLDSEISVEVEGEFEGAPIELTGRTGSLSEILKPTRPFPVDVSGRLFEAHVDARGTIREISRLRGLDLTISAEIPELVIRKRSLPELGTIRFEGQLSDLDGSLGFETLGLRTTGARTVRIDVDGRIDDLLALGEIEGEAKLESGSLDFLGPLLQPLVRFSIPAVDSLSANVTLSSPEQGLSLDGALRAKSADEALVLHARGGVQDLEGLRGLDVEIDLEADDVASVTSLLPEIPSHGSFGPLEASMRLSSHDGSIAASGIDVRLGDRRKAFVELEGHVGNIVALQDVALELGFGASSLHHLKELVDREIAATTPFEGSAAIHDGDGTLGLEHLRLHGGEDGPVEIHLEARLDDLRARDQIEIELGLRSEDTRLLVALMGIDLPILGPVELAAKVHGAQRELEAEGVSLRLGETYIEGSLSGSFATDSRPWLKTRLASTHVRLQDLGLAPEERGGTSPVPNVFERHTPDTDLPFDRLRHVDLDLGLRIDRVTGYEGFEVHDVDLLARLEDGELVVSDASARYQGGQLSAGLRADARTPRPRLGFQVHATGVDIERTVSQFQEGTDYSGLADLDVDVRSSGRSLDALRRSLEGHASLAIRDGSAASRIARRFVVDLVEVAFSRLRIEDTPRFGCGLVDLEIKEGIATVRTLSLSEKEVSLTATGKVDLVKSEYDLRVVPKTSNPGVLSLSPEVLVSGPLDSPTFHPLKRTMITSFARGLVRRAASGGRALVRPFGSPRETGDGVPRDCSWRASGPT